MFNSNEIPPMLSTVTTDPDLRSPDPLRLSKIQFAKTKVILLSKSSKFIKEKF